MNNKKVLIVIPSPFALKRFLGEFVTFLHEMGIDIHLICNEYKEDVYLDFVNYHFIDMPRNISPIKVLKVLYKFRSIVKEIKPDLIHSHFTTAAFLTSFCFPFSEYTKIATIQGVIYTATKNWFRSTFFMLGEHFTYFFQDRVYVLSDDDYVKVKSFGFKNIHLQKSPGFGVNLNKFEKQPFLSEKSKNSIQFKDDEFTVIYIGRLTQFKGYPIAVKAFMEFAKDKSDVKLIICGKEDLLYHSGLNNHEKNFVRQSKNVLDLGFVQNVQDYLEQADVNIFPSTREGMPVNLMESIAMEVPCITSNSRGCRHVVKHFVNGLIIDEQEVMQYVDALNLLYNDKQLLNKLKDGCRKSKICYSRENYVLETWSLYNSLLS